MQSKAVKQMGQIEITGNVIPPEWFQQLTLANGKPNLPAIIILSDIVYWYKPTKPRDEETGRPLPQKQRFKADKLQRSYTAFAEHYGFGKEQVREACHYLQSKGLITLEFRKIGTGGGTLNNVLFLEVVPEAVRKITHTEHFSEPETEDSELPPIGVETDTLSVSSQTRIGVETDTYTEITTEITEREREAASSAENGIKPKLALVSSVEENTQPPEQPFSPNDDFANALPAKTWTIAERFILKACNLWDEIADSEKPVVETNWKTKQAVRDAAKYITPRLNVEKRIGGVPKMFQEFWYEKLKRTATLRPEYVIEQWEVYDRWLIENYETHRRIAA